MLYPANLLASTEKKVKNQEMLNYEIMCGYVQKLQIGHLIPLKTINIVSHNKFYKPGRAGFYA